MKNKIAIASAFLAASSFSTAEIVVNDFLSFEGFVDMSYSTTSAEADGDQESDNSFQIDQVEISWLFDFDPVTAQIDLAYEGTDGDYGIVEQAFATYHFDNGGAITAGRYASMLGFEAFEPTGLYQYSLAYDTVFLDSTSILPGYAQGVKYTHEGDNTFFGISVQDTAFNGGEDRLGGDDFSTFGVEIAGAYYMDNGLSFFLGGAWGESEDAAGDTGDTYVINTYVTFETGAWIFAAEFNYGEDEAFEFPGLYADAEAMSALLMANFAYSDQASVTGRLSYFDIEGDFGAEADGVKYTLAHNYSFTDNLLLVLEVNMVDGEVGSTDYEEVTGAAELIFTF